MNRGAIVQFIQGITYQFRGLVLALKTPKLLALGLIRLAAVVMITVLCAGLILYYHQEILNAIWNKPQSPWLTWLWHILSWLLSLMLVAVGAILSYLISQILFSVLIMDVMSRITERMISQRPQAEPQASLPAQLGQLILQEIPRTTIPVLLTLVLMFAGWLTPAGPVIAILSSGLAVVFLSWDSTDLLPARRLQPFSARFRFLLKTLLFHLGFGLPFLVPGLNILLLSFAPVGATLYVVEHHGDRQP
jgi:CysZ protein